MVSIKRTLKTRLHFFPSAFFLAILEVGIHNEPNRIILSGGKQRESLNFTVGESRHKEVTMTYATI